MPEMDAVGSTENMKGPVKTQAMMSQLSEENIPTDPGTQSDTALMQPQDKTMLSVDSPHSELHTHELRAAGANSPMKLLATTIGIIFAVGLVLFSMLYTPEQEPLTPKKVAKQVPAQKAPLKAIPAVPASAKKPVAPAVKPVAKPKAPASSNKASVSKGKQVSIPSASKPIKKRKTSSSRMAAQKLYQEGNSLIAQGKLKQGLAKLKKAQKADPAFAEVYRALATAHKMNGDESRACRSINQFLKKKKLGAGRQNAYQKRYCK